MGKGMLNVVYAREPHQQSDEIPRGGRAMGSLDRA